MRATGMASHAALLAHDFGSILEVFFEVFEVARSMLFDVGSRPGENWLPIGMRTLRIHRRSYDPGKTGYR